MENILNFFLSFFTDGFRLLHKVVDLFIDRLITIYHTIAYFLSLSFLDYFDYIYFVLVVTIVYVYFRYKKEKSFKYNIFVRSIILSIILSFLFGYQLFLMQHFYETKNLMQNDEYFYTRALSLLVINAIAMIFFTVNILVSGLMIKKPYLLKALIRIAKMKIKKHYIKFHSNV